MTTDFQTLVSTEDSEEFFVIVLGDKGLTKGYEGWKLWCRCNDPDCFMGLIQDALYNGGDRGVKPEHFDMLSQLFSQMTIITGEGTDQVIRDWCHVVTDLIKAEENGERPTLN